tara:strand:+ start:752 stop:994 length:243 start_codon:yes stop_codon:yes gene_type:complete
LVINSLIEQKSPKAYCVCMTPFLRTYYPIILAFISFLFSVTLWFTGSQLEGIFVGIWVPSILSLTTVINQIEDKKKQDQS